MTILFQGNRTIQVGTVESQAFAIPKNVKQIGETLEFKISLVAEDFPDGRTTVQVLLSLDGGLTFPRSAQDTFISPPPQPFRGPAPHFNFIGFSLGPNDDPTHAKFVTTAPAQFTTPVTIEANSV